MRPRKAPAATYRLQFNSRFTFSDARAVAPYLRDLGIGTVYASPIFEARPGSAHGYDVVDPRQLNPELGGEKGFERLAARLRQCGLGLLLDIVPNHLAASAANPWWWDVLKHGRASRFARFLDIDWGVHGGKILLPMLGSRLLTALKRGELRVERTRQGLVLRYFDHRFPLAPGSAVGIRRPERVTPGEMAKLLGRQSYVLAYWRTGITGINYRRFFDISDLAGVRVEDPRVFAAMHRLILRLVRDGHVEGLRVDHIDGLFDPHTYLQRLRRATRGRVGIVVEKILAADEWLPSDWPVEGTTGYELLNALNGVFVDPAGVRRLERFHRAISGSHRSFAQVAAEAKRQVIRQLFAAELDSLARQLQALAEGDRKARGMALGIWRKALVEVSTVLPVYRTYIRGKRVDAVDRSRIENALQRARLRPPVREFLRRVFGGKKGAAGLRFVRRWQQFTGPAMAKGFEDTACYRDTSFVSLNEVGGDPQRRMNRLGVEAFHRLNRQRLRDWPASLNATSTHDTKRSEDVRARLNVLSELAEEWIQRVARWRRWNREKRPRVDGRSVPDAAEENLLYQTLVGAWPLASGEWASFGERVQGYLLKAAREARINTSWLDPRPEYEGALAAFVAAILKPSQANRFLRDVREFQDRIARLGVLNSLAQVVLKVAAPGRPDFYQGSELWDLSLVDPDNRRPVDFRQRARLLGMLQEQEATPRLARRLWSQWRDGRVKLYVTWKALTFRRHHSDLFIQGDYLPVPTEGRRKTSLCVFARRLKGRWVLVVAPRLVSRLAPAGSALLGKRAWSGTTIRLPAGAPRRWLHLFTGEAVPAARRLRAADVLGHFPVALLSGEK